MKYKGFRDLTVWRLSSELAKDISVHLVPLFPKREQNRLGDQIIRSSRSVPSQIAEGFRKLSLKEKNHYYDIASTSNDETENHLIEAKNNQFIDERTYSEYYRRIITIRILLTRLMKSIRNLNSRLNPKKPFTK